MSTKSSVVELIWEALRFIPPFGAHIRVLKVLKSLAVKKHSALV